MSAFATPLPREAVVEDVPPQPKPKLELVKDAPGRYFETVEGYREMPCADNAMHGVTTHFTYKGMSGAHCRKCHVPSHRPVSEPK